MKGIIISNGGTRRTSMAGSFALLCDCRIGTIEREVHDARTAESLFYKRRRPS
jgi:hypothetical protein